MKFSPIVSALLALCLISFAAQAAQVSTPSDLGSGAANFTTTATTGTLSPSGDALLVAVAFSRVGGGAVDMTGISCGFSVTGSWAQYLENQYTPSPTYYPRVEIWWAVTTSSPGTGTCTATWGGGGVERGQLNVFEAASNYNSTTPFAQNQSNDFTADNSPQTTALSTTPNADSITIGVFASRFASVSTTTPDTNWTSLDAQTQSSLHHHYAWADGGATGADVAGFTYGGTLDETAGVIVEIQPAAGGPTIPIFQHNRRQRAQ